ncbi:NUDIX hydrolase [Actinophytocola sp.]|uniref:NUDIX hydrolase n=1 Tax=Actinophytocola sp. TaxID=1872138 RepID=UPI002D63F29D|nr:NUDIX hydrolase [Actinophytocola sp.]HYQ67036.1 NUDIX hydrolase [Actinophytocola sp.]
MASREILAGGAVVWRPAGEAVEVALVHRPRYRDWTLPKGKLEPRESTRVAAWREVREETGARVALGRLLGGTRYRVGPDRKVVEYFAARYLSGSFEPSDEVDELRWLPLAGAFELLSYDRDRTVLRAFTALPADLTSLLLVRHAKAGSRSEWPEADELRPLSRNGEKQVEPIRLLGTVYGADRVYAAPLVRCVRTVEPVADDLGVKVREEELLSEKAYEGMAEAAARRVLEIVADGGVPVIGSQGGVIPDLVTRLAAASGLSVDRRLRAKKGSVWALFFDGSRLLAADYLEVP